MRAIIELYLSYKKRDHLGMIEVVGSRAEDVGFPCVNLSDKIGDHISWRRNDLEIHSELRIREHLRTALYLVKMRWFVRL